MSRVPDLAQEPLPMSSIDEAVDQLVYHMSLWEHPLVELATRQRLDDSGSENSIHLNASSRAEELVWNDLLQSLPRLEQVAAKMWPVEQG